MSGAVLPSGATVGRYRVLRHVGSGAMGQVYLARDEELDRDVALKMLAESRSPDPDGRDRFVSEARAASRLDHVNVGTVYDAGITPEGAVYLVLAYYDGETLEERLARGPLPIEEVLVLGCALASGLSAVHRSGILHRDVKPANIMLPRDGEAKLLDFGVAKVVGRDVTAEGVAVGTISYMSPEQLAGERVDARTDIWALGVVLYECLTGSRPFRTGTPAVTLASILHDAPEPIGAVRDEAPAALEAVVLRCLDRDPNRRYLTADQVVADLNAIAAGVWEAPGPLDESPQTDGHPRRGRSGRNAIATVGVAILAVVAAAVWLAGRGGSEGVDVAATRMAVFPFASPAGDTALARLGRELAVTVAATLDGVGEVRTIEPTTMLAQIDESGAARTVEEDAELARRLGAGSLLLGSLVRSGESVRADVRLYGTDDGERIVTATVNGSPDRIDALTDSTALAVLRGVWRGGELPTPTLSAMTTPSIPALRAYLRGERAFAQSRMREAVQAFEEAFALDSTFWMAYWRSLYPRIYEGSSADPDILTRIIEHRHELPEPDRLFIEASMTQTVSAARDTLEKLTRRFPDYWPGWYALGNLLVHQAPYVGATWEEAQRALVRVTELNSGFDAALSHVAWTAMGTRDSVLLRGMVERMESRPAHAAQLPYYRHMDETLRREGDLGDAEVARFAAVNIGVASRPGGPSPREMAFTYRRHGLPALQIRLADAILALSPRPDIAYGMHMSRAVHYAMRGGWDSALVAADAWARSPTGPPAARAAFGLGVMGVWLGAVDPERAEELRALAARTTGADPPYGRAEMAWLDGVLAAARGDAAAIDTSIARLEDEESPFGWLLERSLRAFAAAAVGDTVAAASEMVAVVAESGERSLHQRYGSQHPYLASVNHLAAAQWSLAVGDTVRASRLLNWTHAVLWGDMAIQTVAMSVAEPHAYFARARIADARRDVATARRYYREFLRIYDMAPTAHGARVEEAIAALRRLDSG